MQKFRKLAQQIYEILPARRCVYFIYTHKNGFDRFYNGLKANTEISYWCYSALRKHFPRIRFLRVQNEKSSRIAQIRPQDIVIGHVGSTFLQASERTKRMISFCPWAGNEDRSQAKFNCAPKEHEIALYEKAVSLILLTSEYNVREYLQKPRNFWYDYFQEVKKRKRVRIVHQPIDVALFKRIKWEYTTDNFLYIGNNAHMKCVDDANRLVHSLGREFHFYGFDGRMIDHLNSEQVNRLSIEADFFIQPGMWEAQCVSILEAAARGFIPIVSPETGYPYEHPFLLRYGDFEYNLKVLKSLMKTSPAERRELADHLHHQLVSDVNHNNWERLTDVLVDEVRQVLFDK